MSKMTIQHCIEINREKIILDSVHIMPKVERGVSRLFDNIFGRVLQTIYHERTSKFDRVLGGLQLSSPKLAPSSSYSALAPLYQGSGTLFF